MESTVIKCQWCGEEIPPTEDGGRREVDLGWLCHQCIQAIESRGEHLEFQDKEVE